MVSSKAEGTATITASLNNVSGNAAITVGPPRLTGFTISPPVAYTALGSTQNFTASGTFTDGVERDVSSALTWTVKNHFIATANSPAGVRSSGSSSGTTAFTANGARTGFTAISATNGQLSAAAKMTVVAPARFALISNNLARESVSLYGVDASTGDLRARGYKLTGLPTDSQPAWTSCVNLDPTNTYAYVSNPGTGQNANLRIYSVNGTSGAFTEIAAGSPMMTDVPLGCIQFEPSGNFGFGLSYWSGTNQLVGYSRDSATGALSPLSWSPMTVGDSPTGLAIDPLGQYLYFVTMEINTGKSTAINGYAIDPATGALSAIEGMPITVSNTATSVAIVHPSANFAYVSHGGGNVVDTYAIDRSTGLLKLVEGSSVTTDVNPSALVFSVDGSYAYMNAAIGSSGNPNNGGTITSFSVDDATGKLTKVGSVPAGTIPGALAVDPSGEYLYSSDNSSYVRVYQIQSDGTPKYVRSIAVRPGQMTIAMVPGDFPAQYEPASLFVTTTGDNKIAGYSIQYDGTLTAGDSALTPATPNSIALLPWSTHAIVAGSGTSPSANMASYSINTATASPTKVFLFGDANKAHSVLMDPGEKYAFESDSADGVLRTYGRGNLAEDYWGLVTYVGTGGPYSTFAAGEGAGPVAGVPSGRFVYIGNQAANSISVFAFWGELFEETAAYTGQSDGSPYSIGAKPIALATDPMGLYLYVVCGDNTLKVFSIDSWGSSHLKQVASVPLSAAPTLVSVDPTGHFLYVGDSTGNVSPFLIDVTTGAPTALAPTLLDAPVTGLTVESSGRFAYVLCGPKVGVEGDQGSIHAFAVNADGTLTTIDQGTLPANGPSAVAFTDRVQ